VVTDFRDALSLAVNAQRGDFNEAGFILRGVNSEGLTPGAFGTPLASFYIDGVQQTVESTRRGVRGTFDMEQLEIYRGPQSTLTGRAALGGAVYLQSIEPKFTREGHVQLTYGSNEHYQGAFAYNDVLGENLAFRFSAEWSERQSDLNYPSYMQYPLYDDFVTDDYHQYRARLLWKPTGSDDTKVLLSYGHSVNSPYYNDIAGPGQITVTGLTATYSDRRGDIWGALTPVNAFGLLQPFFQDIRETTSDSVGLQVTHDFNESLTLTAMTGWNHSVTDRTTINDGAAFDPFVNIYDAFTNRTEFDDAILSQEFRLNYDNGGTRWVAGVYAAREDGEGSGTRDFSALALLGGFAPALLGTETFNSESTTTNYAAFGEISYEVSPGLSLIAGGRVDYFKRETDGTTVVTGRDATGEFLLGPNGTTTTMTSFEDTVFIPKLGVEYEFDGGNQSVGFVYQEGYRPGGAGRQSVGTIGDFTFEPETAKNYELSYRGSFMDDRLGVTAAVFYQDWTNQQVEVWETAGVPGSSYIANVGNSESYGAELELSYAANDRLDLFAAVGLLHTEFGTFVVGPNDYSGLPFPSAPQHSFALGYRWGADTGWFSSGTVSIVGDFTSRLAPGVTADSIDGHTVVDVEVGYGFDNGATLTAYANNLFDSDYFLYESPSQSFATLGERREVGLRLDYRF